MTPESFLGSATALPCYLPPCDSCAVPQFPHLQSREIRGKGVALGNGVLLLNGTFTAIRDPDLCDKPTPYQNSLSLAWGEKPALG